MSNSSVSNHLLLAIALGWGKAFDRIYNPHDADDRVINPPLSEKTTQFLINRAKERRLKKNMKRLEQKLTEEQHEF